MTLRFAHETWPQRVVFATGAGADALAAECSRLDARAVMVIGSSAELARSKHLLDQLPVALVHTEVAMHVPSEMAQRARAAAAEHGVDSVVSIGGGSATGLAKAVALTSGLPVVAVPTTYAGSEATPVWGLTEGGRKTTGTDPRVLPRSVVYDATLTLSLPVTTSVASGFNALAHCVDALWAPAANPLNSALAVEGARVLAGALPRIADRPDDLAGRDQALLGAYLAGVAFASAGAGLHHKICHVLGGLGLPHAETHAVVLPHVLALNAPYAPEAAGTLAAAFGSATALEGLQSLRRRVDAPRALGEHGFTDAQVAEAVAAVLPVVPAGNPAPVTVAVLEHLLRAALQGADPQDA